MKGRGVLMRLLLVLGVDLSDEGVDVEAKGVDFVGSCFDFSIELSDVDGLASVWWGDVGGDGEVVGVGGNGFMGDGGGEVWGIGFGGKGGHDLLDVGVFEGIGVGFFFEEGGGVDELGGGICFVFGEDEEGDGDGGAVEEVGGEGDDGFDEVVVDEVLADFLFGAGAVEDAWEADEGGAAFC